MWDSDLRKRSPSECLFDSRCDVWQIDPVVKRRKSLRISAADFVESFSRRLNPTLVENSCRHHLADRHSGSVTAGLHERAKSEVSLGLTVAFRLRFFEKSGCETVSSCSILHLDFEFVHFPFVEAEELAAKAKRTACSPDGLVVHGFPTRPPPLQRFRKLFQKR